MPRVRFYAAALRDELQISGCANVDAVAKTLNLEIREIDLSGCDGALLRSSADTAGIIAVRRSIRETGRKRFTIAHEIGHRILHAASVACTQSEIGNWTSSATNVEREADEFAAELLLPSRELVSVVNRTSPSLQVIQDLAREYQASLSASAWNFCDVVNVPCAVIWSTREVIQWSRRSDSFRFFLRRGSRVPDASYAMAAFRDQQFPTQPEPVAAHEWIEDTRLREHAEIWEQSLKLRSYESVITLLWVRRPIFDERSDEDTLLPELDPEEFTLRRKRWPGKR